MSGRTCPGCGADIDPGMYACRVDWRRLPWRMKQRINAAWIAGDFTEHGYAKAEADAWLRTHPR